MRFLEKPNSAWLTLNRNCNMRCKWCYAQDTGFHASQSMKLEDAYKAIDIIADIGIESVAILGGEPTIYENIFDVLKYCKSKKIDSVLITNGLKLRNKAYVQKLKDAGMGEIYFAVKGGTKEEYIDVTGHDIFSDIIGAIETVREMKIGYQIAYPFTVFCRDLASGGEERESESRWRTRHENTSTIYGKRVFRSRSEGETSPRNDAETLRRKNSMMFMPRLRHVA